MKILYDKGNQVQTIKNINVYMKGLEGNARNVTIYIQAPANIYYWVDEIQNDTKTIDYLLFNDVSQFLLKIQPSISVGNGTYDIEVHWIYQNDLGISYNNVKVVKIFVGLQIQFPYDVYYIWPILILVGVVSAILIYRYIKKRFY